LYVRVSVCARVGVRVCVPEFAKSNSNGFNVRDCAAVAVVIGRATVVNFAIVRTKSNDTVGAPLVALADVLHTVGDADGEAPTDGPDSELLVQLPTWCDRSTDTHNIHNTHNTHTHTHTHTHNTDTQTHTQTHTDTDTDPDTHTYTHADTHTHTRNHTQARTHTHTHTHTGTCTRTHRKGVGCCAGRA
jgi:hypothetical protein